MSKRLRGSLLLVAVLAAVTTTRGAASAEPLADPADQNLAPLGSGFTYQGKLDKAGSPADPTCELRFRLFDALVNGSQVGATQTVGGAVTDDGLFTVTLDFGAGAFDGQARWIEIAVRCNGEPSYTVLSPRQTLTAVPYALRSFGADLTLPFLGVVSSPGQSAFQVDNTATSGAVHGIVARNYSTTQNAAGIVGEGSATSGPTVGVHGTATHSPLGTGVVGKGNHTGGYFESFTPAGSDGSAVRAVADNGTGVRATTLTGIGVYGKSTSSFGVYGESNSSMGVFGWSASGTAVRGECGAGAGVYGVSNVSYGVVGESGSSQGVYGVSTGGVGVEGRSTANDGVLGTTTSANKSGVVGFAHHSTSYGGYFRNTASGGIGLWVDGKARVNVLEILGADLVENLQSDEDIREPGTVVVIDEREPGKIRSSSEPYDSKVAGVISGAGGIDHGIHLGQGSSIDGNTPVALTGRVYVKCSAENGPIRPGDRLTTSALGGHAMRATDSNRSAGAVIGKAMSSLDEGAGLVLVLVDLQ